MHWLKPRQVTPPHTHAHTCFLAGEAQSTSSSSNSHSSSDLARFFPLVGGLVGVPYPRNPESVAPIVAEATYISSVLKVPDRPNSVLPNCYLFLCQQIRLCPLNKPMQLQLIGLDHPQGFTTWICYISSSAVGSLIEFALFPPRWLAHCWILNYFLLGGWLSTCTRRPVGRPHFTCTMESAVWVRNIVDVEIYVRPILSVWLDMSLKVFSEIYTMPDTPLKIGGEIYTWCLYYVCMSKI